MPPVSGSPGQRKPRDRHPRKERRTQRRGHRDRELREEKRQEERLRALEKEISIRHRLLATTYGPKPDNSTFTKVEVDQLISLEPLQAAFDCDFGGECENADRVIGTLKISGPEVMWVDQSRVFRINVDIDEHTHIWHRGIEDHLVLRLVLDTKHQDLVFWELEDGRNALAQLCNFVAQKRHYADRLASEANEEEQKDESDEQSDDNDEEEEEEYDTSDAEYHVACEPRFGDDVHDLEGVADKEAQDLEDIDDDKLIADTLVKIRDKNLNEAADEEGHSLWGSGSSYLDW